jgi:hypothetical protein
MTAFNGHRALWIWQFDLQAEHDISTACTTALYYSNADLLIVKAMDAQNWMRAYDDNGLSGSADLTQRMQQALDGGCQLIPFVNPSGPQDARVHASVGAISGDLMVDLELYPGFWVADPAGIPNYLAALGTEADEIHVSIDPRQWAQLKVGDWSHLVAGIHPQCYWTDFGEASQLTAQFVAAEVEAVGLDGPRIYPVVPGNSIGWQDYANFWGVASFASAATGDTGCSMWRMGSAAISQLQWFGRMKVGGR